MFLIYQSILYNLPTDSFFNKVDIGKEISSSPTDSFFNKVDSVIGTFLRPTDSFFNEVDTGKELSSYLIHFLMRLTQ